MKSNKNINENKEINIKINTKTIIIFLISILILIASVLIFNQYKISKLEKQIEDLQKPKYMSSKDLNVNNTNYEDFSNNEKNENIEIENNEKIKKNKEEISIESENKLEQIDIFKDFELIIKGTSPFITLEARNNTDNQFLKSISYRIDKANYLKEGDIVTVSASYSSAEKAGYEVISDTKEFKIENVDKYVDYKNITNDYMKKLIYDSCEKLDNYILSTKVISLEDSNDYIIQDYKTTNINIDSTILEKIYSFELKEGLDHNKITKLIFVYHLPKIIRFEKRPKDIYILIEYDNIIKHADGTFYCDTEKINKKAYELEDSIYEEIIKKNEGNYYIEEIPYIETYENIQCETIKEVKETENDIVYENEDGFVPVNNSKLSESKN